MGSGESGEVSATTVPKVVPVEHFSILLSDAGFTHDDVATILDAASEAGIL